MGGSSADHTLVMGVLNVTPDSFSDGGHYFEHGDAIDRGMKMREQGADLVDVGGESTRPGAEAVTADEEIARVLPVVRSLTEAGVPVSIDTSKASVAEAAVGVGAIAVNDISALGDPDMAGVVADSGCGLILMHMKGDPRTMQADPRYEDVVAEVTGFLVERARRAEESGVTGESICLDPGIGFGKTLEHNLRLLGAGIPALAATGYPVAVGASRKSFIEMLLGPIAVEERDPATAAAHVLAIAGGAALIRVHNVVMGLRTARMADAIVRAGT